MKLRILENSIRLRIERSELRLLLANGLLERHTCFSTGSKLVYALRVVEQDVPLQADLACNRINISVDLRSVASWARSDKTSIEFVQRVGDEELCLLLEKDFPCQHSDPQDHAEKFTPTTMTIDSKAPDG